MVLPPNGNSMFRHLVFFGGWDCTTRAPSHTDRYTDTQTCIYLVTFPDDYMYFYFYENRRIFVVCAVFKL